MIFMFLAMAGLFRSIPINVLSGFLGRIAVEPGLRDPVSLFLPMAVATPQAASAHPS
jgi:hypothetical protein